MRAARGFVLIEMLTVIAMIALLAAILFPVFARARERARAHSCLTNQVNIMLAIQLYASDHAGRFPPVEDDVSPLVERYLRSAPTFQCPSTVEGVPMGAPANSDLSVGPAPTGPGTPGTGQDVPAESADGEEEPLRTSYYYRAGHRRNQAPATPILSDHDLHHIDRANVMWSDGRARRVGYGEWRELGFRAIGEVWPPGGRAAEAMAPGMGGGTGGSE